jgi:hypothetical protein
VTDLVPDNRNRIAYAISIVFHPFVIALPTLLAVLREMPVELALSWTALILLVLVVPLAASLIFLRQRGKYAYQRRTRLPIYLVGWTSILLCLALTVALQAPKVLVACMAALALWIPLQFAINTWITKISIHSAVITGCVIALWLLGAFPSLIFQLLAVIAIAMTAWARMVTRNHTVEQVLLGIVTGGVPVLLVFPILLGR